MTKSAAELWEALAGLERPTLAKLFAHDPDRVPALASRLELDVGGILFDWSKTHLDGDHLALFPQLAEAMDFAGQREALFSGAAVNATEGRAAEHPAQRGVGSEAAVEEAGALHARMPRVRCGTAAGDMGGAGIIVVRGLLRSCPRSGCAGCS